jgi:hypothetical protein
MRKLVSVVLAFVFVSVVPALAAAELSMPESCCTPSADGAMKAMSCCAMTSCSMSSLPDPVRAPNHQSTAVESGQKLPAPKPVVLPHASLIAPAASSFETVVELLDPSPPPGTSERLAVLSCYLI